MLKDLIRDTDKAVAKAQAAVARLVGKPQDVTPTTTEAAAPASTAGADQSERLA